MKKAWLLLMIGISQCGGAINKSGGMNNDMNIKPVVSPEQAQHLIKDFPNLILVDARSGSAGKKAFQTSRLKNARYVDLDLDLADVPENPAMGGRHPLPSVQRFGEVLGKLGITPETYVLVYDDKSGANAAARFWWMLLSAGHQKVSVIDGGIQGALAAGFSFESGDNPAVEDVGAYPVDSWKLPVAEITDIERMRSDTNALVIDVRDAVRFRGEKEPIDKIAGHIPGARNIPFSENLGPDGRFLPADSLRKKYEPLLSGKETAVHCGSGVTACHTLLAMAHAGLPLPKLYVGSWSEWSNAGKLVAVGN
jgi:thiosulfate/3-mercaptopyruvate sulfurtransferase